MGGIKKKYTPELKQSPALQELLAHLENHKTVTLIYDAKDEQHNQAVVLKEYLEKI